jgi:hypothetical protein
MALEARRGQVLDVALEAVDGAGAAGAALVDVDDVVAARSEARSGATSFTTGSAASPGPPVSPTSVPVRVPVAAKRAYATPSVPAVRPLRSSGTVTLPHCALFGHGLAARAGGRDRQQQEESGAQESRRAPHRMRRARPP